jgi:hypothetical protein
VSRARTIAAICCAAWASFIALAYVSLEPTGIPRLAPLLPALAGLTAAVVAALACTGGGAAILSRLQPAALDDDIGWLRALGVGLAAWGPLSLLLSALLGVHTWVGALSLALLATGWLLRPSSRPPRLGLSWIAWGLLLFTPAMLSMLSPITDTDELYYHLALPARMLDEGCLLGGAWMPNGSRPLALHLAWAWLMGLGGTVGPRAFHMLLAAALLLVVHQRARAWWGERAGLAAPLLLLGSASFLAPLGLAYADIPCALLVLLALDAAMDRRHLLLAATAGGALAIKYTAVVGLAPLFLLVALASMRPGQRDHRTLRGLLLAGLGALGLVAPWWLRNVLEGLHPLFPFTGWADAGPFTFQFPEKYGMGQGWLELALLPWNIFMHAEPDSSVFLGRLNPALLALAPAACWAAWRDRRARLLVGVVILGLAIWSQGTQWLRYLIPLLPVAALAAAAGIARLPRWGAGLIAAVWLLGLPANLQPILSQAARQAPVALGLEPREQFIAREVTAWPAIHWLNEHSPPDARVALLYSWQAALLERPWVLGSVEDHVPTRHLLALHGDGVLEELRRRGVTHVLTSRVNFLHKSYPFLDEQAFEAQFEEPESSLERALRDDAVLMFEQGRHAVYRL